MNPFDAMMAAGSKAKRRGKRPAERHNESASNTEQAAPPQQPSTSVIQSICWWTILVAVATIPITFDMKGMDWFRVPKEIAFVAVGCLLTVCLGAAVLAGRSRDLWAPRHEWLYLSIAAWTFVTALLATNPVRSALAMALVASALVFCGICETVARHRSHRSLLVVLIPAVLNAGYFVLQDFAVWDPLLDQQAIRQAIATSGRDYTKERRTGSTAFAGGPTDTACSLVPAALLLAALAVTERKRRVAFLLAVGAITAVVIITQVLTGIAAATAGLLMLAYQRWRWRALMVFPALLVVIAVAAFTYPPVRQRLVAARSLVASGQYDSVLSGRLTGFAAALEMVGRRPVFGVGPGCFATSYFEHKLEAEERYPSLLDSVARPVNFGSAHNDFLDVLAETGIPGLLLMLIAIAVLMRQSFGGTFTVAVDGRKQLAVLLSAPLAVAFCALALAAFPLSLYGSLIQFLFAASVCRGWAADAP